MSPLLVALTSFASSFLSSFAALFVWFHYDIEGAIQHKRHDRMVKRGKRLEEKAKQAKIDTLTHEFRHFPEREAVRRGGDMA